MKKVSLKQIKNLTPAEKASFALLIANLVLKGLSLISGPVFTRIMSTEQYGIVSTFQSWLSLLTVVVTLNLSQGVFNNGMLDFKKDRDKFQFSLLFISSVITLAYAVAFFALKKYVLSFTFVVYRFNRVNGRYNAPLFFLCPCLPTMEWTSKI